MDFKPKKKKVSVLNQLACRIPAYFCIPHGGALWDCGARRGNACVGGGTERGQELYWLTQHNCGGVGEAEDRWRVVLDPESNQNLMQVLAVMAVGKELSLKG